MRKRENTDNLACLTGEQIVTSMSKASLDDFFPSRKMKKRCRRLCLDKTVPRAIMRVLEAANQYFVGGIARHLFPLALKEDAVHPIPSKVS